MWPLIVSMAAIIVAIILLQREQKKDYQAFIRAHADTNMAVGSNAAKVEMVGDRVREIDEHLHLTQRSVRRSMR